MANGILDTSIPTIDIDKIEKASGSTPGRARLTGMTITTLRYNIQNGYIVPAMERFNEAYANVRRDVVADEVRAAENEMLATAGLEGYSEKELQLIRESNMVTLLSSPEIVNPKLNSLGVSLVNAETLFPRRKENSIVVITEKQYSPKALKVYSFLTKVCKRIDKSYSIPFNTSHVSIDAPDVVENETSNWRSLFADVALHVDEENENIDINKTEILPEIELTDKVIKEEITKRKMIAQIGDELTDIDRLLNGIASTTPFNQGLLERRNVLLSMLSNLTGVKTNSKINEEFKQETTEFQQLIDEVSGYTAPLTEEEHKRLEAEFEEHYSDPDVIQNMNDLQLKNILFDLNKPEAHARVIEAERLDDATRAERSVAVDLIDIEPVSQTNIVAEPDRTVENNLSTEENAYLKSQGEIQAEILHNENVKDNALEQAQLLMNEELVNAGLEQAQSLLRKNYEEAGLEQAQSLMKEELRDAGYVQAQSLLRKGYEEAGLEQAQSLMKEELRDAGYVQAQSLIHEELRESGRKQAIELAEKEAIDYFKVAGESQAQILFLENMKAYAEEQARMLNETPVNEVTIEKPYELFDVSDRYASIISNSKPLRVSSSQVMQIRDNYIKSVEDFNDFDDSKDMLVSLRAQLEDLGLGAPEEELGRALVA